MKKRLLSLLLSLVLVVGLLPTVAFADSATAASGGTYDVSTYNAPTIVHATTDGQTVQQGNNSSSVGGYKTYTDSSPIITGSFSGSYVMLVIEADKGATAYVTIKDYKDSSTNSGIIWIKGEGDAVIEIDGENSIKGATDFAAIQKNNSGWLILQDANNDGGTLTVAGGGSAAAIGGGNMQDCCNLRITGGKIYASSSDGAAIGGGENGSAKNIEISGGTVVAISNSGAAGIGGGACSENIYGGGNAENITISGGEVYALSSGDNNSAGATISKIKEVPNISVDKYICMAVGNYDGGAGIGSGAGGSYARGITITGGKVVAAGSVNNMARGGAGIGSGTVQFNDMYNAASDITITGGTVYAYGGDYAAGIGSGTGSNADGITIGGDAVVTAVGSLRGAGIGTGGPRNSEVLTASNITINGGTVKAYGGLTGAGIGGGAYSNVKNITITGGNVEAIGSGSYNYELDQLTNRTAAGIGSGYCDVTDSGSRGTEVSNIVISGGTVTARGVTGIGTGMASAWIDYAEMKNDSSLQNTYGSLTSVKISGDAKVTVKTYLCRQGDKYGACIGTGAFEATYINGRAIEGYGYHAGVEVEPDISELSSEGYIKHYCNGADLSGEPTKIIYGNSAPATTYTVSFDSNGGSGSMTAATGISGTYTLPACGFTAPAGQQFKGWATSATGEVISGATTQVTTNTTLYAIWEDIPATTYTVSFDSNGGSGNMDAATGISGTYTLPACTFTAPAGQQFKGWATSATGEVLSGTTTQVTTNITLYAIWEEIPATTYTVSFDSNGGSGSMDAATGISGTYTLPACTFTAPAGQQFKGWATSATGEVISGATTQVTTNTTLYAIWEEIPATTYTVSFDSNGGSGSMADETGISGTYTLPACTFTAPAGQQFKGWATSATGEVLSGTTTQVTTNITLYAIWEEIPATTYTVSFDSNGGSGSMDAATGIFGTYTLPACTFTAPAGQQFKGWATSATGEVISGATTQVTTNTTLYAIWEDIPATTYTVTVSNDGNGMGSASPASAAAGTAITLRTTANTGYHFKEWQVVSGGVTITDNKFTMPNGSVEVKAIFEADTPTPTEYTVTFDGNGGTSYVPSMTTTNQKLEKLPTATRSGRYSFDGWYTAANGGTKITTAYVFSENTTVYAHWTYTGGGSGGGGGGVSTYAITVKDSKNGTVTADRKTASSGATVTLTVSPEQGWTLETLTATNASGKEIDLNIVKVGEKYTFKMPASNVTVAATFMEDNTILNYFVDVPTDSYYYNAVLWAVEQGITQGTDATHFSPEGICTRAQAVTFLWRAAGSPAPRSSTMPFTDVKSDSYYYDAVLWAVENGITKGTGATEFSPNQNCSRAQIVTFLWRSEKSPAAGTVNPFTDVKSDAYYADAVLWAVKEDVTKGTTGTTFSPSDNCTRAQIVTFIYRALAG